MKTIALNFDSWNSGANTFWKFRKTYKRVYLKGYIWTPFVVVNWKLLK